MRGKPRGWSLIEVLVVLSVVALLVSVLLPVLSESREAAKRVNCLANLRSLGQAHGVYLAESNGRLLGTSHSTSWIEALRRYDETILLRSPVDDSPHFAGGVPIGTDYRLTSYGLNLYASPDWTTHGLTGGATRIDDVPRASATVHMLVMAFTGPNAVADHVHATWFSPIGSVLLNSAALEVEIAAYGETPQTWRARSGYVFLDGHAESMEFGDVYTDPNDNQFNPSLAY